MNQRYYQRTHIDVECMFFLSGKEISHCEFSGILENISESGVMIIVDPSTPSEIVDIIGINDHIHFDGFDEYNYFGEDRDDYLSGDVTVVRKESSDGRTILGCKFGPVSEELTNYIADKKTCSFCKTNSLI